MTSEQLTAILLAAIAAPGFWEVLKSIVDKVTNRRRVTNEELADSLKEIRKGYDAQQKDIDGLKVSIRQMQESESVKDAQAARRRILRFNDELLRSIDHSKEYFDDILEDIKIYNRYCDEHNDFVNGKTVMAKKNIEHCYEQCMEKHSFLN
jgi:malate synthase